MYIPTCTCKTKESGSCVPVFARTCRYVHVYLHAAACVPTCCSMCRTCCSKHLCFTFGMRLSRLRQMRIPFASRLGCWRTQWDEASPSATPCAGQVRAFKPLSTLRLLAWKNLLHATACLNRAGHSGAANRRPTHLSSLTSMRCACSL